MKAAPATELVLQAEVASGQLLKASFAYMQMMLGSSLFQHHPGQRLQVLLEESQIPHQNKALEEGFLVFQREISFELLKPRYLSQSPGPGSIPFQSC